MYDQLIALNEEGLPTVEEGIQALWEQNREYFDPDSDFYAFMERGATELTFQEKMAEQKQLWETLGLDQKIRDMELLMHTQQFVAKYSTEENLTRSMLDRNFSAQNVIANRLAVKVDGNEKSIIALRRELASLNAENRRQNKLLAEQTALLRQQLETAQQTEKNTQESILDG